MLHPTSSHPVPRWAGLTELTQPILLVELSLDRTGEGTRPHVVWGEPNP